MDNIEDFQPGYNWNLCGRVDDQTRSVFGDIEVVFLETLKQIERYGRRERTHTHICIYIYMYIYIYICIYIYIYIYIYI